MSMKLERENKREHTNNLTMRNLLESRKGSVLMPDATTISELYISNSGISKEKKEDKPASLLTFFSNLNFQSGFSKFMPPCL